MRAVKIVWKDTGEHRDKGWASAETYLEGLDDESRMLVTTVGVLVHQDDRNVVIALSYDQANDTYFGAQVVAREAVRSMKTVRL